MDEIKTVLKKTSETLQENFPLSALTSFKTGGPARFLITPADKDELIETLEICKRHSIPILILGKGTNILISDAGFNGVVISTKNLNRTFVEGTDIHCQSGVLLSSLLKICIEKSLKGMEFLSGIPGTIGGAIISNAGLKKEWLSEKLIKIKAISFSNIKESTLSREEIPFKYRASNLEGYLITDAIFRLDKGKKHRIKEDIARYMSQRIKTQPLGIPSAGSVFKNPQGSFAGMIIEKSGLKGYAIGDASISDKHANFIINKGEATSEDIYKLIHIVKRQVKKMYNIELETEIKIIGSFGEQER